MEEFGVLGQIRFDTAEYLRWLLPATSREKLSDIYQEFGRLYVTEEPMILGPSRQLLITYKQAGQLVTHAPGELMFFMDDWAYDRVCNLMEIPNSLHHWAVEHCSHLLWSERGDILLEVSARCCLLHYVERQQEIHVVMTPQWWEEELA